MLVQALRWDEGVMSTMKEKFVYMKMRLNVASPFHERRFCAVDEETERNG